MDAIKLAVDCFQLDCSTVVRYSWQVIWLSTQNQNVNIYCLETVELAIGCILQLKRNLKHKRKHRLSQYTCIHGTLCERSKLWQIHNSIQEISGKTMSTGVTSSSFSLGKTIKSLLIVGGKIQTKDTWKKKSVKDLEELKILWLNLVCNYCVETDSNYFWQYSWILI